MRIGVSPFANSRASAVALATDAIEGGIDTLWLGDGLLLNDTFSGWAGGMESLTELAWLAGRFPEARIAIGAAVLPLRDVEWVVKQANTLDQLTEGNFVLAVAAGFWAQEAEHRGFDFARRGEIFADQLAVLRDGLAGNTQLSPVPHSPGGPPLWLAGGPATMTRALDLGLPFQARQTKPDQSAALAAEWFDRGGGLLANRIYLLAGVPRPADSVDRHTVGGSADEIVEALGIYRDVGIGDLSIVPGNDDTASRRTIDVLVSEVLPQLSL